MAPLVPSINFGEEVDEPTFEQILDMDDDDEGSHDFSRSIVMDFLDQAEATIQKMEKLLEEEDLEGLSGQGHFLKGSSATLGFVQISRGCEMIQHYGQEHGPDGTTVITKDKALSLIKATLAEVTAAYEIIKDLMTRFYDQLEG